MDIASQTTLGGVVGNASGPSPDRAASMIAYADELKAFAQDLDRRLEIVVAKLLPNAVAKDANDLNAKVAVEPQGFDNILRNHLKSISRSLDNLRTGISVLEQYFDG